MKKQLYFFIVLTFIGLSKMVWGQTSETFFNSDTWICPDGVTTVTVECWGGGGPGGNGKATSGGNGIGGGGAGGAYAKSTITVIPENSYIVTVGASQTFASFGNPSWFGSTSTVFAEGGANGLSGISTTGINKFGVGGNGSSGNSIGIVVFKGGNGFTTSSTSSTGGGGSAGTTSNGNSATSAIGASVVSGGGAGGNGAVGSNQGGSPGSFPGGGGGGGWGTNSVVRTGGAGAAGQVILTYTVDPLPVELTSFSASIGGDYIRLEWNTSTEVNNYGFEIQKQVSSNESGGKRNAEWDVAGFVNGNGNSNSPKEYSFVDTSPQTSEVSENRVGIHPYGRGFSSKLIYRLKQIDTDGSFEYSNEIEIEIGSAPMEFNLAQNYPNPFNPETTIEFTLPENGTATLKIFNTLGEEVATLFNEFAEAGKYHQVGFNASTLSSGIYYARLQFSDKLMMKKMLYLK